MAAASCPWPAAIILKRPINPSVLLGLSLSLPCLGNIEQFNKRYQEASRISCLLQVPRNLGAQASNLLCSFQNIAPSCTFSHRNRPEPILIKLEFLKLVVQQNENAARFLAIYFHRTACASSKFVGTGRSDRPSSVNSCCPGDWTAFNNPQQQHPLKFLWVSLACLGKSCLSLSSECASFCRQKVLISDSRIRLTSAARPLAYVPASLCCLAA
jgi:hypothetical protein